MWVKGWQSLEALLEDKRVDLPWRLRGGRSPPPERRVGARGLRRLGEQAEVRRFDSRRAGLIFEGSSFEDTGIESEAVTG